MIFSSLMLAVILIRLSKDIPYVGGVGGEDFAKITRGNENSVTKTLETRMNTMKLCLIDSSPEFGSSSITRLGMMLAIKLPTGMELLMIVIAVTLYSKII